MILIKLKLLQSIHILDKEEHNYREIKDDIKNESITYIKNYYYLYKIIKEEGLIN